MIETNQNLSNMVNSVFFSNISFLFSQISSIAADILRQNFNKIAETSTDAPIDTQSYFEKIINKNLNLPAVELFSSHILHPRDMNLEQLECHLRELETKEMNTRGVLRRLLTLNCRQGKLERALEIKQLCELQNVELSPGMMANIFDLYTRTKDLPKATATLDTMKQQFPGFLIDEHKMLDYAALMVEHEHIDEAKQVLKKYAAQHKLKAGNNILKNIWQLLKNVSMASGTLKMADNQTSEFLKLLVQLGYCDAKNNTLLGPIIREYFQKGEVRKAVEKYKEICIKYRKTPLQLELYTLLIGISNQTTNDQQFDITPEEAKLMLEECIDQSSAVHGSENTHIHLIVALAEAGTANQLRKLLIDPSVRINLEILKSQCERFSELGKIEPLLKLAKASRGLGHINEQELYNIVLNHYVRANDYEAALGLYERIFGEDDYKLSANFMKNLVDLLEKNNLEIPTSIAVYAKREN
jgi:leucine-rich PPR motif-containing protein, mitochondrial